MENKVPEVQEKLDQVLENKEENGHDVLEVLERLNKELENKEENGNDDVLTVALKIKCCYCHKDVESFNINQHKMQCELQQQTMCEFCGICVKQRNLKNHVLKVHTKTMLCETCGKFFSWNNLKTHSSECTLDPVTYCELCSRIFFSEKGYKVHMQRHEQGVNQFLRMKIKGSFQDEFSLVFYCPVCGKGFQDKISVVVHLNGNKIVTCRPCNKVFSNERAFLVHVHKPNQAFWHCRRCFRTFERKYSWQIHERTHSLQNRSYCCKMCGKQYPSLESLLQHILCHGSNYICTQCNTKFSRQSLLKEHILHHEGFIHKCKSCGMQFQTTRHLRFHKAKVHDKKILFQKRKA